MARQVEVETRLLGPAGVAKRIGVSRAQLYALGILDQIPTITIGLRRRYDREDVDRWIEGAKETNRRNHR